MPTSRSPSPAPSWTSGTPAPRAGRAGSSGAAAAWSTPTCCAPRASTGGVLRVRVRHGRGAHAHVPQRCARHARHDRGRRPFQPALRDGDLTQCEYHCHGCASTRRYLPTPRLRT
nr:hypothetical protein [Arthrobacter sp. JCM 19049]